MECFEQTANKERVMMAFYRNMDSNTRKMILKTLDRINKIDGKLTGNNKILQKVLRKLE